MGQAKLRAKEIEQLKAISALKENGERVSKDRWAQFRPIYVSKIKQAQEVYMAKLMTADKSNIMSVMKEADEERMWDAVQSGLKMVQLGIATLSQIKDAAWEGFNGLMEANCVEMNIQHELGLPVSKINVDDFIITGPDAMKQAQARGWFA